MSDPFEPPLFAAFVKARWRVPIFAAGAAAAVALAGSLILTPKYTARVSLIIEPPAAADPRASVAVSPVYLESLRTYAHLASSDQLFAQALERFELRPPGASRPIEQLKEKVLRVSMPRNTRVLEIAVTLPDPLKAHAFARFLADETMRLSRAASRAGDEDLLGSARRDAVEARRQYEEADRRLQAARGRSPGPAELEAALKRLAEQQVEIERLHLSAELSIADQEERRKEMAAASDRAWELGQLDARIRSTRARAARLREQAAELRAETARTEKRLSELRAAIERLGSQAQFLRNNMELEQRRMREVQTAADFRGERISLLDPGVVPERPSSPNLLLNLVAAAGLALAGSFGYLTLAFLLRPAAPAAARPMPRMVAKS